MGENILHNKFYVILVYILNKSAQAVLFISKSRSVRSEAGILPAQGLRSIADMPQGSRPAGLIPEQGELALTLSVLW